MTPNEKSTYVVDFVVFGLIGGLVGSVVGTMLGRPFLGTAVGVLGLGGGVVLHDATKPHAQLTDADRAYLKSIE